MAILSYRNLTISFSGPALLKNQNLSIERGEKICLVGRNGEGKSTLLRLLANQIEPDTGEIEKLPDLRIAKLDQEIPAHLPGTVLEVTLEGLGDEALVLKEYHEVAQQLADAPDDENLSRKLGTLQEGLDASDGWSLEHKAANVIDRVGLRGDESFDELSGGNKSRALLARSLVSDPHLLLLDEPTNHLDIPGIRWLEEFLRKSEVAVVFVSHDRAFASRLANTIIDLDRARLSEWNCSFDEYLKRKNEFLEGEAKQQAVFDKKLSEEEVWIRKGIQARRTRNEGRVRTLKKMRVERVNRRETQGNVILGGNEGQSSGRKVISVENASYRWSGDPLIENLSTTIWRGDRIGIVGLNGSGKSTLLKLLLKQLEPAQGTVKHGTKLEVAYFDQHRDQLDEDLTVAENVNPLGESLVINGHQRHVLSYLKDFLFTPETARAPITKLSGGERARLLLARLFLKPANLLVLDEPTNDLDVETIELLEERLQQFDGTLLLVSHDRAFLNNVVTATYALDGKGLVTEYAGGCDQWLSDHEASTAKKGRKKKVKGQGKEKASDQSRKLLNKEREALRTLPELIEKLESEHEALGEVMNDPAYYNDKKNDPARDAERLEDLQKSIGAAYRQWEELDAVAGR
jgi:ABC transport system ATP-binding/permease protein